MKYPSDAAIAHAFRSMFNEWGERHAGYWGAGTAEAILDRAKLLDALHQNGAGPPGDADTPGQDTTGS